MECLGGNGYVEDSLLPRLYREAPVNAIWEGSGNVMCLDVLRVLKREPEAARAAIAALAEEADALPGVREAADRLTAALSRDGAETEIVEAAAHATTERLALLGAAAALRTGAPSMAEGFARTRLAERRAPFFGSVLLERPFADGILQRALGG
jgi:putative acyl-CoA dehydrogenase